VNQLPVDDNAMNSIMLCKCDVMSWHCVWLADNACQSGQTGMLSCRTLTWRQLTAGNQYKTRYDGRGLSVMCKCMCQRVRQMPGSASGALADGPLFED